MDLSLGLLSVAFGILLASAATVEVYYLVSDYTKNLKSAASYFRIWQQKVAVIINDFLGSGQRSARYYIPWSRPNPVLIGPDQIQELSDASQLSQRAVYADIFGFKYTLKNDDVDLDPAEQAAHRYRLYSRAIRVTGLAQIDALQPFLQSSCEKTLRTTIDDSLPSADGWTSVRIAPMMRDLASGMLSVYFFGEELSAEPEFSSNLLRFYQDVIACMGALQVVPAFLSGFIYRVITKKGKALSFLFKRLNQTISKEKDGWHEKESLKPLTLLHNMIEASKEYPYWTADRLIQAMVGIWFAASHQPWINLHFVLLELCDRPEYVELIRKEIESQEKLDYATISRLPVLDSFIKESVRLNPLDLMSIRRKALKPYTFSHGGPHVEPGQIACYPAYEVMHNGARYTNPDVFDGLRFVKNPEAVSKTIKSSGSAEMRGTTLTEGSKDFPIWGFGSKICPGRWHGALVLKLAIIQMVSDYDFRVEDTKARRHFLWETFQMPYESTRLLFRKRVR
ncbi:hypothetical protein MMC13_004588 [Lambiella insularis]|nr:hypothetical protein [Lambiella insularis]